MKKTYGSGWFNESHRHALAAKGIKTVEDRIKSLELHSIGKKDLYKTRIIKKKTKDIKGMTIPKGTKVFIIKSFKIKNPIKQHTEQWKIVRIDNGTGNIKLMPQTAIKEVI